MRPIFLNKDKLKFLSLIGEKWSLKRVFVTFYELKIYEHLSQTT